MTNALMVVDMQNAVLHGIASAGETISTVDNLLVTARREDVPVVWVQHEDTHDLPGDSPQWRIVPGLRPDEADIFVRKQYRSAFAGTGLAHDLRAKGVEHIVLTGAQSAFCVDMAGKHALAEGFSVTLVSDGHCNGPLTCDDGDLDDAQVRGLINRTWSSLRHPGVSVDVAAASAITW